MSAQLREQPARLITMWLVIVVSSALGSSVFLVNSSAVEEFDAAARRVLGNADVVVRSGTQSFSESLYPRLAKDPRVIAASPVIELQAALAAPSTAASTAPKSAPGSLQIFGIDCFRAGVLQASLLEALHGGVRDFLASRAIVLSSAAAVRLNLRTGDFLALWNEGRIERLQILAVLADAGDDHAFGLMDIATSQWMFGWLGRLNRIDAHLRAGVRPSAFAAEWAPRLPPGVVMNLGDVERSRASSATRAYRVNLNMLALISLLTSAFLVFAIQSLSLARRRVSLAILRALGVSMRELRRGLLFESLSLGSLGIAAGILLGFGLAAFLLAQFGGDLGNDQLHAASPMPQIHWPAVAIEFVVGLGIVCFAMWIPATEAARREPAPALRSGDVEVAFNWKRMAALGSVLLVSGAALSFVPASAEIPIAGYCAIAALLFGGILWIPQVSVGLLALLPRLRSPSLAVALAQMRGSRATLFLSLAPLVVSFALMVAMAILVHSFRDSFESWLAKLLPADLQVREPLASDTASWTQSSQAAVAQLAAISRADFRRTRTVYLMMGAEPVQLIARDMRSRRAEEILPLLGESPRLSRLQTGNAWISESLRDRYRLNVGTSFSIGLQGARREFRVAGIWRDYAHPAGAIVIERSNYIRWTADSSANEASFWLTRGVTVEQARAAIVQRAPAMASAEFAGSTEVRRRSLALFDRAFAVTYALEALAVSIGLAGIGIAASFAAITRRAEFGLLRHVGMRRRDVLRMVAAEGLCTSFLGSLLGLCLGVVLSVVLIFVVNRQSFHWSIDFRVPVSQLAALTVALMVTGSMTAVLSGRSVLRQDALAAVREDW